MQISNKPRISIVTPSFNQSAYLEQTIQSVLGQKYPNLEYLVIDGGSTDGSIDIIKKYENHLTYWETGKDSGQANALNRGLERCTGDILGWINSDDYYLPGTFSYIASEFLEEKKIKNQILFGNCLHLVEDDNTSFGSNVCRNHEIFQIELFDYIIQPSCFWSKDVFKRVGRLNEELEYTFDWDFFIRASNHKIIFSPVSRFLSVYRVHSAHKTGTGGRDRLDEIANIYSKYIGSEIAQAYLQLKLTPKINTTHKLLNRPLVRRFFPPDKTVHRMFFSKIPWSDFNQLLKM